MNYHDFEVWIRAATEPTFYPVSVTSSPSGPASNVMHLDLAAANIEGLLTPVMSAADNAQARDDFGEFLFSSLFAGPVGEAWNESIGRVRGVANQWLQRIQRTAAR